MNFEMNVKMANRKLFSLVLLRKGNQVLLGMKKRGFGKGKWNGFGGKVEANESVYSAALRELKEECGLIAENLDYIGILHFEFKDDPIILEVHVFTAEEYVGLLAESDEMAPKWFSVNEIPFKNMWPDDELWFPLFLRGVKFRGYFYYKDQDTIEHYNLSVVEDNQLNVNILQ